MKTSAIVLVALAATSLMRRRSAAVRHWILSVALACAAAMPALEFIVPSWYVGFGAPRSIVLPLPVDDAPGSDRVSVAASTASAAASTGTSAQPASSPAASSFDVRWMLIAAWIAGAAFGLFRLAAGLARLAWLASRSRRIASGPWVTVGADLAERYRVRRRVDILQSTHPTLLVTWGMWRPRVILPSGASDWPVERIRIVLGHEMAHIVRGDWLCQMIAELLRSAYWFNPLLWIACRRLRQDSEQACDDAVLALGIDGPEYASHLLDLARAAGRHHRWSPPLPAAAIARPSSLERRVRAMLNRGIDRSPTTERTRGLAAALFAALALPIAGFGQAFVSVAGTVVDPNGAVIPGATVVLANAQDSKFQVRTDGRGRFEFPGVPAGEYSFGVETMGFKKYVDTLNASGASIERRVSLEVGSIQETLRIVATKGEPQITEPSPRRAQAQPLPTYDPCSVSPVGGCLKPPVKIGDMKPRYPQHLVDAGISGRAILDARIGVDGSVVDVTVVEATDPAFGESTADAVRQWQFVATRLGGVPIETNMKVTANFVMR